MANQQIIEYVKASMAKGMGVEDIRSALLKTGWPEADVSAGIVAATGNVPAPGPAAGPAPAAQNPPEEKKKGHKGLIIALIVLVIVVIVFLYVAANIVTTFNEMFPEGFGEISNIISVGG